MLNAIYDIYIHSFPVFIASWDAGLYTMNRFTLREAILAWARTNQRGN